MLFFNRLQLDVIASIVRFTLKCGLQIHAIQTLSKLGRHGLKFMSVDLWLETDGEIMSENL
jgi:hypothetical protein